ncbi:MULTISPECIES: DedA family protein [Micromonospora]|uniref:DedA family protein n=1 Tax=Micromonospora solifontis TaxID=2487138 RepID=A0ABX9WBD4_9ACTN|nr:MULTISPECIES: DedA family protein [Micromonospora]NES12994.1 DedA family protein [Micromonospora sp. PPF5-17B]NES38635.1 DedA family protein [Micromonospora solifontis]NES54919.1 DedA family protein [Micromonospora sp. PPF5-6]RNL94448.1 DedA family protein [Micromonospora solifontis]
MDRLLNLLVALPPALVLALVFLLPALEASTFLGLLVPGELAVLVGGVLAHEGRLPLAAVIVAALAGAALGDQIGFLVGRRYGRRLLDRTPRRFVRSGEVRRALDLIRRRGAAAVVLGRWAAALRALVPGLAGMSGIPRGAFTVANVAGGALWAVTVAVLGYLAGASYRLLERRLGWGGEAVLALVVLLLAVWVVRSRRAARRERKASAGRP